MTTMWSGVPGRIVAAQGSVATVEFWGVRRPVRLDTLDQPVVPGDYILNHDGFAVRRIAPEELADTLAHYEWLLRETHDDELLRADIQAELTSAAKPRGHA